MQLHKIQLVSGERVEAGEGKAQITRHREEEIMRKAGIYNFFFPPARTPTPYLQQKCVKHSDQLELRGWEVEFLLALSLLMEMLLHLTS